MMHGLAQLIRLVGGAVEDPPTEWLTDLGEYATAKHDAEEDAIEEAQRHTRNVSMDW